MGGEGGEGEKWNWKALGMTKGSAESWHNRYSTIELHGDRGRVQLENRADFL